MSKKIGILGGGQLGRMLYEAGSNLGIEVYILDEESAVKSTLKNISKDRIIVGSYKDQSKILELAKKVDVITYEIEHINVTALKYIENELLKGGASLAQIQPRSSVLEIIQDKWIQKLYLKNKNIPIPSSFNFNTDKEFIKLAEDLNHKFILKSKRLAYDGRGNWASTKKEQLPNLE